MNMKQKIFNQLVVQGKRKTAAQLAAQYNTTAATIRSRISEIRNEGCEILSNRKIDAKGVGRTFYHHPSPTATSQKRRVITK